MLISYFKKKMLNFGENIAGSVLYLPYYFISKYLYTAFTIWRIDTYKLEKL